MVVTEASNLDHQAKAYRHLCSCNIPQLQSLVWNTNYNIFNYKQSKQVTVQAAKGGGELKFGFQVSFRVFVCETMDHFI